jgi:3-hydroxymyristoyl/3-hydroxydecanoyl-(acyl carrier protein) dehydratase
MTMFADLKSEILNDGGRITAQVEVPADSIWFNGHFPEDAILPGVAQIAMVVEILCDAMDKTVYVSSVRRVRFKQTIRPGERITVEIAPKENKPLECGFRLMKGVELACSGFINLSDPYP